MTYNKPKIGWLQNSKQFVSNNKCEQKKWSAIQLQNHEIKQFKMNKLSNNMKKRKGCIVQYQ